jgi:hypothetical protein
MCLREGEGSFYSEKKGSIKELLLVGEGSTARDLFTDPGAAFGGSMKEHLEIFDYSTLVTAPL